MYNQPYNQQPYNQQPYNQQPYNQYDVPKKSKGAKTLTIIALIISFLSHAVVYFEGYVLVCISYDLDCIFDITMQDLPSDGIAVVASMGYVAIFLSIVLPIAIIASYMIIVICRIYAPANKSCRVAFIIAIITAVIDLAFIIVCISACEACCAPLA